MKYYTLTDFRGIWALLKHDGPQVFQYRTQHKRWDEAPWHLPAILGFGDMQEVREVAEVSADADQIGHDLETGAALAYLSQPEIHPDVDRVIAVYPDGRAYGWHQLNDKTPERGVMD